MTTRPRVAVTLGTAGLGVAVAQVLLLSSPPTWFQIAVVAFWGVVGGAYLASGLGQRWRDRLRPPRPRVPDGELSTGDPGDDADVVRRDDVGDAAQRSSTRAPGDGAERGSTPTPTLRGAVLPFAEGPGESTEVVPAVAAFPVRAARPRLAPPVPSPVPAVAGGRPAPPSLAPAAPGGPVPSARTVLPGAPGAGTPAPDASAPAGPGTVPPTAPPTALETTAALVSPWPHAAVPSAPPPVAAPSSISAPPAVAAPSPLAGPQPVAAAAPAEVTDVHPRALPPPAPASPPVTATPGTSPSFAIRLAEQAEPAREAAGSQDTPGDALPAPRAHTSGRHAVPEEPVADETAPRRHRHRRPADTLEQPVPISAGAPAPSRRHRAPRRRAS